MQFNTKNLFVEHFITSLYSFILIESNIENDTNEKLYNTFYS